MATIGIDARMYGPAQTGIGTYIQYLLKHLALLDKTNEYVLFVRDEGDPGFRFQVSGFRTVRVNAHWYSLAEQTKFLAALYKAKCDLVHFPHFNLPLLYNRPFVVTIHDLTPKFFPGHKIGKSPLRRRAYDLVLNHAVHGAKAVITPSEFTKNDVIRHLKVKPEKIAVIYEGIKDKLAPAEAAALLNNFEAEKQQAFQRLQIKFGHARITKPFIFYVGVWRNHKNVTGLIKAFHILVNEYRMDYQLVIGGKEDPHYPEVRATWRTLGLDERVYTPGMIFGEELNLFYRAARLFALPSFYEGFGLVTVEALNQGTPVVASLEGPVPEVIGEAGVYFDPKDPEQMAKVMADLLKDPARQKHLVQKGQKTIEKYSWENMAREALGVYKKVISTKYQTSSSK